MSNRLLFVEPPPSSPPAVAAFDVRFAADIALVLDGVTATMVRFGYPGRDVFGVRLALEEALVNALKHGHGYDPTRRARVRYRVTRRQVLARVTDQGPGFDPAAVADPLTAAGLERSSGRGLLLMRRFLSWVRYNRRGNGVTLCRRRSPREGGTARRESRHDLGFACWPCLGRASNSFVATTGSNQPDRGG